MKIISPEWNAPPKVHAYFTTRDGGHSKPPYSSLNLAHHVDDDPESVLANRKLLDVPAEPAWLNQTHSSICINVDHSTDRNGDAAMTRRLNVPLAVMVADCLPILVTSIHSDFVCVIHAGWKGLANDIIKSTLSPLEETGLIAWVGPAIGPCHYQVGQDVRRHFDGELGFQPDDEEGKFKMDLRALAVSQLSKFTQDVTVYEGCTFSDREHFFSYRRDGVTGRMAGLIYLAG